MDMKLVCSVKFYSEKRKTLPDLNSKKYCPHLMVKGDNRYLGISFIGGDAIDFDIWIKCIVSLFYEEVDYSKLTVGAEFHIMEGRNNVGEGVVLEVLKVSPVLDKNTY